MLLLLTVHWVSSWSENSATLLVLGAALGAAVYIQLEDLKHPSTARRLLGKQITSIFPSGRRLPSEEDTLLAAAGRRIQRDWWAWLALFVPSFAASSGAVLCADAWTAGAAHGWMIFAAALLCYGAAGAAADPVRCIFLKRELARCKD